MSTASSFHVRARPFGTLGDGRPATVYELVNPRGVRVEVTNYGGIIASLWMPDARGMIDDVVLGYDDLAGYVADPFFMGSLVGRYANRIAGGAFSIDGRSYAVTKNDGPNHLHGGPGGFHKVLWEARPFEDETRVGVTLSHRSPDGHEGYPGNLELTVSYGLTRESELYVDYQATTDRTTIVNLTQHTYFNLAGQRGKDILDHELVLLGSRITPVDATLIPTGAFRDVGGTPFDFRTSQRIGGRLTDQDEQLRMGGGYDHNWVLDGPAGVLRPIGRARCPSSGRMVDVATTEPGVQFYAGQSLGPRAVGKGGVAFSKGAGFCLETQHFPDSPNKPHFPSTRLRPGETYRSTTMYRFSASPADAAIENGNR